MNIDSGTTPIHHGRAKVYELARGADERPWMLTVSLSHPYDPYVARRRYWDLYADCEHLMPEVEAICYERQDPHSQRILDANDRRNFNIDEQDIRRARRAYFANVSYLDAQSLLPLTRGEAREQPVFMEYAAERRPSRRRRCRWSARNRFPRRA